MEISFEPYNKISFKSYLEHDSPEDLARIVALTVPVGVPAHSTFRWANGVLFSVAAFQATDSITKEYLAGHLLWDHIDFALMPTYEKEIKLPDKPLVTLNVLNLSEHPLFGAVGKWIKENLAKKKVTQPKRS